MLGMTSKSRCDLSCGQPHIAMEAAEVLHGWNNHAREVLVQQEEANYLTQKCRPTPPAKQLLPQKKTCGEPHCFLASMGGPLWKGLAYHWAYLQMQVCKSAPGYLHAYGSCVYALVFLIPDR